MPANLITELFHNIMVGQPNPTRVGVAEKSQRRDHGTGPDFAGMLAGNLKPRPRPDPKPEPPDPKPETPDKAGDRPQEDREQPTQAAAEQEPPADTPQESAVEQPVQEQKEATQPATKNSEEGIAKQGPTSGEQAVATKGTRPVSQGRAQVQASAGTSSPPVPTAVQAGFAAMFDALFAGGGESNNNQSVPFPVSTEGGNEQGGSNAGQTRTALPQAGVPPTQVPQAKPGTPAEIKAKPTPQAKQPSIPKVPAQTAPARPQISAGPVPKPPDLAGPQRPAQTVEPLPAEAAARPIPAQPEAPPRSPVMLEQATVIRENDAPGTPLVANADDGTPPQPTANDNNVALELARILLGVRIVQTAPEQILQVGQPVDPTPTSEGKAPANAPSPLPGATLAVPAGGGAEEAGNQSLRPGPNMSAEARTALIHAGEQGSEPSPAEQVVRAARAQIGARHSQVQLQLEPPELGRVRIDVRMSGRTIQMHVQTQTEQAHQLLNSRAAELRNTLQAQGLNVERLHIELRSPSQTSSSHQQDHSGTNNPMRDAQPDAHRGGQNQAEGESQRPPAQGEPEHAFEATVELNEEPEDSSGAAVNLVA